MSSKVYELLTCIKFSILKCNKKAVHFGLGFTCKILADTYSVRRALMFLQQATNSKQLCNPIAIWLFRQNIPFQKKFIRPLRLEMTLKLNLAIFCKREKDPIFNSYKTLQDVLWKRKQNIVQRFDVYTSQNRQRLNSCLEDDCVTCIWKHSVCAVYFWISQGHDKNWTYLYLPKAVLFDFNPTKISIYFVRYRGVLQ